MRYFVALILALLAAPVNAQTAPLVPPCFAKPLGTGTYAVTRRVPEGEWAYWYCLQTVTTPFDWEVVVMANAAGTKLTWPALDGLTTQQSLEAVWKANVSLSCTDPSIKTLCTAAQSDAKLNKPSAPLYLVAKNGTTTTRPMYAYMPASGSVPPAVGAVIVGSRAAVGSVCDCATRGLLSSGNAYCMLNKGMPSELTVCTKQ